MRLAAKHLDRLMSSWNLSELEVSSVMMRGGLREVVCLGEGDPLLLVPALAGGWRLLLPLASELAKRHRVILVGLAGDRGLARGAAQEQPSQHAKELSEVITSLRLERPTVFGLSFGAAVALELALRFPSQVGRLVLMGAEASFHSAPATAVARRVLEQFPLRGNSWFVNQFFNLLHGNRLDPGPISEHIVSRCWETDQGVIASRLRALESFDVSDELWQLDVPTLVFAGSRDVIVSPDHQRSLAESISGARFEPVMGAGHVGFLTHRVELVRVLARWLRAKSGSFL